MIINDKVLNKLENALDIKLYKWQREYIKGKMLAEEVKQIRGNGKTLAYILRLLLYTGGDVTRETLKANSDEEKPALPYRLFFAKWAQEINEKLKAAGVYEYAKKQANKWHYYDMQAGYYKNACMLLPTITVITAVPKYAAKERQIAARFLGFYVYVVFAKGVTNERAAKKRTYV